MDGVPLGADYNSPETKLFTFKNVGTSALPNLPNDGCSQWIPKGVVVGLVIIADLALFLLRLYLLKECG